MGAGALFVPAAGGGAALAQRRPALGIPAERRGETKSPVGVKRRQRGKSQGLPCALVAGAALYGRASPVRAEVAAAGGRDAAPVPADTLVSLRTPRVGRPPKRGKRGRPRTRRHGLRRQRPQAVRAVAQPPQTGWAQRAGRPTAR